MIRQLIMILLQSTAAEGLLESLWVQLGAIGLLVFAMGYMIWRLDKNARIRAQAHTEERKEWREAYEKQHEEALEVTKGNTSVLHEIRAIIKLK